MKKNFELISTGVSFGTIQLLPNGQMILLMADHQTTGGYPRIGHVISAHLPKLAQLRQSDCIYFKPTDIQTAEKLLFDQNRRITNSSTFLHRSLKCNCMLSIDLNCDLGEGCANDNEIMPLISSANIACGYHAGDEHTIEQTIKSALKNNVAVGAHPSFFDKENFGRKEFLLSEDEYYKLIIEQLSIIQKIAKKCGTKLHHVKPHGALYNVSAKNKSIANIIAKAVNDFDKNLILYGLSGSYSISEAEKYKLKTASEVFADRTYQSDGSLTPRGLQTL